MISKFTLPVWIRLVFVVSLSFSGISCSQKMDPIFDTIERSEISVALEEVVRIPDSKAGTARLNMLTHAGDGSGRLFVNDMEGKLYVIVDGVASVYMDLRNLVGDGFPAKLSSQQGFSYFAFHPEFAANGVFYTVNSETKDRGKPDFPVTKTIVNRNGETIESSHHSVVREWTAADPLASIFFGKSREILRVEQPYKDHNMGQLGFNPRAKLGDSDYGLLFIAVGDGGSDGFPVSNTDLLDNGQDLTTPLGKILRMDPFGGNGVNSQYGIPNDNPFANDGIPETLGEIWAYGLRNPHRFSWDTGGEGKMLIADIGQAHFEEINLGIKGANYGWGEREGTGAVDEMNENVLLDLPANDKDYGFTYAVAQYGHDEPIGMSRHYGIAIAGGFVYRGTAIPELAGQYVFADFGNDGRFFHVPVSQLVDGRQAEIKELRLIDDDREVSFLEIIGNRRSDVRFGTDEEGELYVTSKSDGEVRKLVRSPK